MISVLKMALLLSNPRKCTIKKVVSGKLQVESFFKVQPIFTTLFLAGIISLAIQLTTQNL